MPPKAASSKAIWIVVDGKRQFDSAHASSSSAEDRLKALGAQKSGAVMKEELSGGSIVVDKAPSSKTAKKPAPVKETAKEDEDAEDDEEAETSPSPPPAKVTKAAKKETAAPKAAKKEAAAPKAKTKTSEEQLAANKSKPGKADEDKLPENVKSLLSKSGDQFGGQSIVVTGVPPVIGRKNAELLVEAYGGKVVKAISKKTAFVVLGNDAGPKKLEQISDLGLTTYTDEEFVKLIESAGGKKRAADDEEEEEEKPKAKKAKKT